uniref:Cancer/testis antigen 83 n=1 Tax=Saimiri boliviensis boliviensis TaxID=39432 RepID=A0A2K6TXY7_SAIBB|nr:kita-kyushu lung cancer antigen 1 homolog [Saimiri boliviensis boliviensis]
MYILLLLASGILCALMFFFGKYRFQRSTDEMSSNSTAFAPVKLYYTGLINSNTDNNLSINSLSRDIFNNFPHSVPMQKRLLLNLRMVEYELAELEHFLVTKGLRGVSAGRKSTQKHTRCNCSGGNH